MTFCQTRMVWLPNASRDKNAWQHVPVYLQQFPSYSNHNYKQEAQLLQRDRVMPRVVEYFR